MLIDQLLARSGKPSFSFEFFPPKDAAGEAALRDTLQTLRELQPDFVSVTQTGTSTRESRLRITRWIQQDLGIEAMAHLTCADTSAEELRATLSELRENGIENVLALRGDAADGEPWRAHPSGFDHAAELARAARDEFGFSVGAACFPEGHPDSPDMLTELGHLREKVQAGAGFLVTQIFFDNDTYFRFVDAARVAGIDVPILPGIMPITNAAQIERIAQLSGAQMPAGLLTELHRRAKNPEAVAELGVAFATLQCAELLARGAPGIHFYTLNRSPATRAILTALRLQKPWLDDRSRSFAAVI